MNTELKLIINCGDGMHFDEFYYFGSKLVQSTLMACPVEFEKVSFSDENVWNLIKGNYDSFEFPLTFRQEDGKILRDILETGWSSRYLISSRLKELLENQNFTGWKTYPIKLYDKKSNEIHGYHGFSVTGKCAPISFKNSKIIEKQFVPTGPICKYFKGIDLDEWDGSDFFCPEGNIGIYVTRKVTQVLKGNKITNVRFEDVTELEFNVRYGDA